MKIAILGFGTVGSGVYEELIDNKELITKRTGQQIEVKYVCDIRDFSSRPDAEIFIKDFDIILRDNEVSMVIETMGGVSPAYQFTKQALMAGKHVVTSNKALVAAHGEELLKIAKEKGLYYLFEASVGGGIPIINPLNTCMAGNEIVKITGILNGTTNYILTQMFENGQTFESALADAQAKGYAEKDPTDDIEGKDAARKIAILAAVAWGILPNEESIYTEGITKIDKRDVKIAEKAGCSIKLVCCAEKREDKVFARVCPMLVPKGHPLYAVSGVYNAIVLTGNYSGDVMFYGSGAGKEATASAVCSDIVEIARGKTERDRILWNDGQSIDINKTSAKFMVRTREEIKDAKLLDVDQKGEKVYLLPETEESEFKNIKGIIKSIRRI